MTEYEPRGYLQLTRREDAKLSEESEDYANLYIVSSRWGYKLVRRTIQEDAMGVLMLGSLGLAFAEWEPGDPDKADLVFSSPTVTLDDINHLETALQDFFEELRSEYGIDGQFDFNFLPDDPTADTIALVWFPDSRAVSRVDLPNAPRLEDPIHPDQAAEAVFEGLETPMGSSGENPSGEDPDWMKI